MKTIRNTALVLTILVTGMQPARSQTLPESEGAEAVFTLSPFEVNASEDTGYYAANTLSGTRLNTSLLDTPASVTDITQEFLQDIAATETMDVVEYSLGFQKDYPGSNDNLSQFRSQTVVARGVGRENTVSRDYFPWDLSDDAFSTERLSQARGPNSVLFGLGNAGGIINTMSKRALFTTKSDVGLMFDNNGSARLTLDQNFKLSDKIALRVNGLTEDRKTWRELEYIKSNRVQVAGTWKVFSRTELRFEYERGVQDRLMGLRFSGRDNFIAYLDAGSPVYNREESGNTYPDGVVAIGTQPRLMYDGNQWLNLQRQGVSRGATIDGQTGLKLQDETYLPFEVMLAGPTATTDNDMWTYSLFLTQEVVKNLFVELGYNQNSSYRRINRPVLHDSYGLRIDPNATLPGGVENPHFGEFFIEGQAVWNDSTEERENKRALVTYKLDPERDWMGEHQFLFLWSSSIRDSVGNEWREANLTPFSNQNLTNAQNIIWRRTYLDYTTPEGTRNYDQNPFVPQEAWTGTLAGSTGVNPLTGTITPGYYWRNHTPRWYQNDSTMFAGQSRFLNSRLVVTYGYRRDTLDQRLENKVMDTVTGAVLSADLGPVDSYKGNTKTLGAVVHLLKGLSLYVNTSDNFSPQSNLDLMRQNIGNVKGEGQDFGIKFAAAENKLYARLGYYKTTAANQGQLVFNPASRIIQIWEAIEGANGPYGSLIDSTSNVYDTQDFAVEGYEVEITANPVKGMRLTFNFASLDGYSTNINPRYRAYIAEHRSTWEASSELEVPSVPGRTVAQNIAFLDESIADWDLLEGERGLRNYKYSYNFFGVHQFQKGVLKGWSLGGGVRYRTDRLIGYTADKEGILAPDWLNVDANIGYRRKLFNGKVQMRLQLNVTNLLDDRDLIWSAATVNGYLYDFVIPNPRKYTFTASFSF